MQSNHSNISVLIPTFNRCEYLAESIESIINQTLEPVQIIVIDDGSTDDTSKILTAYKDKMEILHTDQLGKSGALNVGLKSVKGDYVWIFDDDDVAMPDALERLVQPLMNNTEYGFSYLPFYYAGTNPETGKIGKIIRESDMPDVTERGFLISLMEWNFLGGAALFARTHCYHEVGEFDEELIRSQDYDMAIRIAEKFQGVRAEGGPTLYYRQHNLLRGSMADRFKVDRQKEKWFRYGQLHFQKRYKSMGLERYLPPGKNLEQYKRQAILQRAAIMAFRHLIDEIIQDFKLFAELKDVSPLTKEEYAIVWGMLFHSYYTGMGALYDCPEFFSQLRVLSKGSNEVKFLRKIIMRMLLSRTKRHPRKIFGTMKRIFKLYVV